MTLQEALKVLTESSCLLCGAEPGCDIDCPVCHLVAEVRRLQAAARAREDAAFLAGFRFDSQRYPEVITAEGALARWREAQKEKTP